MADLLDSNCIEQNLHLVSIRIYAGMTQCFLVTGQTSPIQACSVLLTTCSVALTPSGDAL